MFGNLITKNTFSLGVSTLFRWFVPSHGSPIVVSINYTILFRRFLRKKTLFILWITTIISTAHKPGRCTVIKCLRRRRVVVVEFVCATNGCTLKRSLYFHLFSSLKLCQKAQPFSWTPWLSSWSCGWTLVSLHILFLPTHLTFLSQSPWRSTDLHSPSTEPYNSGILLR